MINNCVRSGYIEQLYCRNWQGCTENDDIYFNSGLGPNKLITEKAHNIVYIFPGTI
jgi:hypothetical protein